MTKATVDRLLTEAKVIGDAGYTAVAQSMRDAAADLCNYMNDANRWRGLMASERMHWMGSSGFAHKPIDGNFDNKTLTNTRPEVHEGRAFHFGMEFWSEHPAKDDPRYSDAFERRLLIAYADAMIARSGVK